MLIRCETCQSLLKIRKLNKKTRNIAGFGECICGAKLVYLRDGSIYKWEKYTFNQISHRCNMICKKWVSREYQQVVLGELLLNLNDDWLESIFTVYPDGLTRFLGSGHHMRYSFIIDGKKDIESFNKIKKLSIGNIDGDTKYLFKILQKHCKKYVKQYLKDILKMYQIHNPEKAKEISKFLEDRIGFINVSRKIRKKRKNRKPNPADVQRSHNHYY